VEWRSPYLKLMLPYCSTYTDYNSWMIKVCMVMGTNLFLLFCFLYFCIQCTGSMGVGDKERALIFYPSFGIEVHEKSNLLPVWSDGFILSPSAAFNLPFCASYVPEPTCNNNNDNIT